MTRRDKIASVSLVVIIFTSCTFFLIFNLKSFQIKLIQQSKTPEKITAILGPGYSKTLEKVVEMCGKDVQLLQYRPGGYYNGKVYPMDTQLSKDKLVEYSFTKGNCSPGHSAVMEAYFDLEKNSVSDGPKEHGLAADTRKPISDTDLQGITISIDEAAIIGGQQPIYLLKSGDIVTWVMMSRNNGQRHEVWINATTGEKMKDTILPDLVD